MPSRQEYLGRKQGTTALPEIYAVFIQCHHQSDKGMVLTIFLTVRNGADLAAERRRIKEVITAFIEFLDSWCVLGDALE